MADSITTDPIVAATQDVAVPKSDTTTVFGTSALTLPTPPQVKAVFKVITFIVLIAGLSVSGISEIPDHAGKLILEYAALLSVILQKAEDFWGIQVN